MTRPGTTIPLGLLLVLSLGCDEERADVRPEDSERVNGAVTALMPNEGLAYLAGRALVERPGLQFVRVSVARDHVEVDDGGGGTVVHGPSQGEAPVRSVRLEADAEGAALVATARLGELELEVPVLRRPPIGVPERCFVRLSALGGLAVTRMLPSTGSQRRLQVVDAAELTLEEAVFEMDEECAAAIRERSAYLRGALEDALATAISEHLNAVAQVVAEAAGPSQPLYGGTKLRAWLAPSEEGGPPLRVRQTGIVARFEGAVDAEAPSGCAPAPEGGAPPAAAAPNPPVAAPGGSPYRLALAIDGAFLDRAIGWAAAGGAACRDEGPQGGLRLADIPDLPGVATLVTGGRRLLARLRPGARVRVTLADADDAPLRVQLPGLHLDLYGDVDGAPLALARLRADVEVAATVTLGDDDALRLTATQVTVRDPTAAPTVLPEGPDGVAAAAQSLYSAAVRHVLSLHALPARSLTGRPVELVAVDATDSHLLLYLDLR